MPKPVDPDRVARLAEEVASLEGLTDTTGWAVLRERAAQQKEKSHRFQLKALMRGLAVDQRDIDYERGYWDGINEVLRYPEIVNKQLETALKRAQQTEGDTE